MEVVTFTSMPVNYEFIQGREVRQRMFGEFV